LSWSNLDVSVNTPLGTPGVLDEDVVLSIFGSVTVSSSVWVVSLGHEWGGFDVFESVVHKATVAYVVLLRAVNELLLRVGGEDSGGDLLDIFDGFGDGESPAWSTLSLVLDWSDSTFGNPVVFVSKVGFIKDGDVGFGLELGFITVHSLQDGRVW
jgi:hypothetical protein